MLVKIQNSEALCTVYRNVYNTTTMKIRFLRKLEIDVPCNPTILLLGIHTQRAISYYIDTSSPHVYNFAIHNS